MDIQFYRPNQTNSVDTLKAYLQIESMMYDAGGDYAKTFYAVLCASYSFCLAGQLLQVTYD